jgi:hypothetical protein
MNRNTKLKIAGGVAAVAAAVAGGVVLGPAAAAAAGLTAVSTFLLGLFHDKPEPKEKP